MSDEERTEFEDEGDEELEEVPTSHPHVVKRRKVHAKANGEEPEEDEDDDEEELEEDEEDEDEEPEPVKEKPIMSKQKRTILNEPPIQEITKILDSMSQVNLRIVRVTPQNHWISIASNHIIETLKLKTGEFEKWLEDYAGGGAYVIDARDPITGDSVVPRWRYTLPGMPKDPKRNVPQSMSVFSGPQGYSQPYGMPQMPQQQQQQQPSMYGVPLPAGVHAAGLPVPQMIAPGQLSFPPAAELPNWAKAYDAQMQWQIFYKQMEEKGRLPQGASMHSDQLSQHYAQVWQIQHSNSQAENSKLHEKLESMEREHRREVESIHERYKLQLEKFNDKIANIEKEKTDARIEALRTELLRPKGPQIDWAAVLAAGAPVLSAYVNSNRDQARIESDRNLKQMELQTKVIANSKTDIAPLLAGLAPIVVKFLENTSPQARMEAQAEQDQTKMMMMKMVSDMVAQHAQVENPPPWLVALQHIMEGISDYSQKAAALQPGQPRKFERGASKAPSSKASTEEVWERLRSMNEEAATLTKLVWDNVPVEAGFQTHEWRILIFNIHCRVEPQHLAPMIVHHLQHLAAFDMLPPALSSVFSEPSAVMKVLGELPIAKKDAGYTKALGQATMEIIEKNRPIVDAASENVVDVPSNGTGPGDEDTDPETKEPGEPQEPQEPEDDESEKPSESEEPEEVLFA